MCAHCTKRKVHKGYLYILFQFDSFSYIFSLFKIRKKEINSNKFEKKNIIDGWRNLKVRDCDLTVGLS